MIYFNRTGYFLLEKNRYQNNFLANYNHLKLRSTVYFCTKKTKIITLYVCFFTNRSTYLNDLRH